jgi:hypothetical protein
MKMAKSKTKNVNNEHDNETIVPKTREEYVAHFRQLYSKSAAAKNERGVAPIWLTEITARRELEMYRLAYEAQRTLDYWEFAEFWKEIGLNRDAICKFVHIGKAYPSLLRWIEIKGQAAALSVALMIQLPLRSMVPKRIPPRI